MSVKYPDLMPENGDMEEYTSRESYRDKYLSGNQERDANGDRLWCCIKWYFLGDDGFSMFEVETAEGPLILCGRRPDGSAVLQVQDGKSPERTGECAEIFVRACEAGRAESKE